MVVVGEEAGPEGFGRVVQTLAVLFYEDGEILSSLRPDSIQEAQYVLMGIFDQVGLSKNVNKIVVMVYQPCSTSFRQPEVA